MLTSVLHRGADRANQSIARARRRDRRAALVALAALVGCAGLSGDSPRRLAERLPDPRADAPAGALVVQLAFGARADLDLYVTDPLDETVYFANTPSRSGGALRADAGCADAAPRIETVVFAAPLPGRYRVGVDHAGPCDGGGDAAYAVRATHGDVRAERVGEIAPLRFAPVVLELEVP